MTVIQRVSKVFRVNLFYKLTLSILVIGTLLFHTARLTYAGWEEPVLLGQDNQSTQLVFLGDINGDGSLDVVTNEGDGYPLPNKLYLNNGRGKFQQSGTISDSVRGLADLNGDGTLDLLTNEVDPELNGQESQLFIHYNNGQGEFPSRQLVQDSSNISAIAIGDVNGNGALDIVASSETQIFIYKNDGSGGFTRTLGADLDHFTFNIHIADIDSKNGLDIVTHELEGFTDLITIPLPGGGTFIKRFPISQVNSYLNNGLGQFAKHQNIHTSYEGRMSAFGDIDGDGALDLVMGEHEQAGETGFDHNSKIFFNLNDSSGTFQAGQDIYSLPTTDLALGDIDNNGTLDIVVATTAGSKMAVFSNLGDRNFDQGTELIGAFQTTAMALGELNGDGFLDIILGNGVGTGSQQPNVIYFNDAVGGFRQEGKIEPDICVEEGSNTICSFNYPFANLALGDVNNDQKIDIVGGSLERSIAIHTNDGTGKFEEKQLLERPLVHTNDEPFLSVTIKESITLADLNNDKTLDILETSLRNEEVVIDSETNMWRTIPAFGKLIYYENQSADVGNFLPGIIIDDSETLTATTSVAVGDLNHDGNLDLVIGDLYQPATVFLNDGDANFTRSFTINELTGAKELILRDFNNDGGIDLLAIAREQPMTIYLNQNDGYGTFGQRFELPGPIDITSIDVADLSGNGHLDIITTSFDQPLLIQYNDGQMDFSNYVHIVEAGFGEEFTISDTNNDGLLDIVVNGRNGEFKVYINAGVGDFKGGIANNENDRKQFWYLTDIESGDLNGDGHQDLVTLHNTARDRFDELGVPSVSIFLNMQQTSSRLPQSGLVENQLPMTPYQLDFKHPISTGQTHAYSSAEIFYDTVMPIEYTLFDDYKNNLGHVMLQYSSNRGGTWHLAANIAAPDKLTSTPYPQRDETNTHIIEWDTFNSGFFGQSDDVVLRLVAYQNRDTPAVAGTYKYYNNVAGSYRWPYVATTSFPFRVGATQVKVYENETTLGSEAAGASVYRLIKGLTSEAELMPNSDVSLTTNFQGVLPGAGELDIEDELFALLPQRISSTVPFTDALRLFATNLNVEASGVSGFTVTEPGIQEIVASENQPLMLFDLDVSLEWDARKDTIYLDELEFNLQQTSEIIFDYTNGQAALGDITIYHNKERWNEADIHIYATNDLRPHATIGGLISTVMMDTFTKTVEISGTEIITQGQAFYEPGHVEMGAVWNRYGNAGEDLGLDWARTLAHELGHYLFFLHDNYIGLEEGRLIRVDGCPGAMSNPYIEAESEFHPESGWDGSICEKTFSHQALGKSDWETILHFYPWLNAPDVALDDENVQDGPAILPLAVTRIITTPIATEPDTLDVPSFDLTLKSSGRYAANGKASAFLLQGDRLVDLGAPRLDRVQAWNARPDKGDRLCVYDLAGETPLVGCEPITGGDTALELAERSDWRPEIAVSAITSTTIAVTLTVESDAELPLSARIYPSQPVADALAAEPLTSVSAGGMVTYTGVIQLAQPTEAAYIHVFDDEAAPTHGVLTQYSLGGAPTLVLRGGNTLVLRGGNTLVLRGGNTLLYPDGSTQVLEPGEVLTLENGSTFTITDQGLVLTLPDGGTLVLKDGDTLVLRGGNTLVLRGGNVLEFPNGDTLVLRGGNSLVVENGETLVLRGGNAPIRSSDGQLTLFGNATNVGPGEFYTLQATSQLPDAPLYTTQVGQAYRLTPSAGASSLAGASVGFSYLGRNIDENNEHLLQIYYYDAKTKIWQPLENTFVDEVHNLASAIVPEGAGGAGVYALMYSIDVDLAGSGWDTLMYPVQGSRSIDNALSSIQNQYAFVYHHDRTIDNLHKRWTVYTNKLAPDWVDTLQTMEFGETYYISVTAASDITVQFADASASERETEIVATSEINAAAIDDLKVPPTTFYGTVLSGSAPTATFPQLITAWVGETICGQAAMQYVGSQSVYTVIVAADGSDIRGCGEDGATVNFTLGSEKKPWSELLQSANISATWNNGNIWAVDLVLADPAADADGDGISNELERTLDGDNDGEPDIDIDDERVQDIDGDGIPNFLDLNSDGDEYDDATEAGKDINGNGIADFAENNVLEPTAIEENGEPTMLDLFLPFVGR